MEEIFKGLDLSDEAKLALKDRIESAKSGWIEGSKNNPEFIKKIRNEEAGKFYNTIEKVIKRKLNVNLEDIDDSLTGIKRQEALLQMGIESFEKNKDKTNQDLQSELLQFKAKYKELEEEGIPNLLSEERQKHYKRYISEGVLKDTLGFETTCNERARVAIVSSYLQENKYKTEWDNDSGTYKVITSENLKPTFNDKPIDNKELIRLALDDAGVLKKSNGSSGDLKPELNGNKHIKGQMSNNAKEMLASFN